MSSQKIASRVITVSILAFMAGCDGRIYVRDGVTDGNRFSLPTTLAQETDPVVHAWAAYSLAKSICQLEMGGSNPARNSSLDCEVSAREALAERWRELIADRAISGTTVKADRETDYLEQNAEMHAAGVLDGYSWRFLRRRGWRQPSSEVLHKFDEWSEKYLEVQHKPYTRIIGSWGYIDKYSTH